jgi:YD repeat-containing protein
VATVVFACYVPGQPTHHPDLPRSNAVTYTYSYAGHLSSLEDWGSRTTSYTYTPAGLAATVTLPNSMVTTYTYDRAQRLTSLTNVVSANHYMRFMLTASENISLGPFE